MNAGAAGDNPPLIVGLDLEEVPVRLVLAEADEPLPYILDHRSFRSERQFRRYWGEAFGNRRDVRLAVSSHEADPLNLLSWLEGQGIAMETHRYPVGWLLLAMEVEADFGMWGLPRSYQTAYALTLGSAYRLHAASMTGRLWNSALQVEELLEGMKRELHRLTAALPQPPSKREVDCPF